MISRHHTRAKILATLGPASAGPGKIRDLVRSGVDGFRINLSHGDPEERLLWVERIKRVRSEMNRAVAILLDLRGPRLRLGPLPEPIELKPRTEVWLNSGIGGPEGSIPVDYPKFASDLAPGHRVLLRDGRAKLKVLEIQGSRVRCRVQHGAWIHSNQGVNLPDSSVSAPILSAKDKEDIAFAAKHQVDFLALSFVRRAEDVETLRRELLKHEVFIPIIAKIEHPEALKNLDQILEATDGVMVARGDLAVEMGHEAVPTAQKKIIRRCMERAVPVITATQMLESMIEDPQPTRAEVSDVANAVLDGTDAVMLSGETAVGAHPLEAVRIMHRIVSKTEQQIFRGPRRRQLARGCVPLTGSSVEMATVNAAATAAVQSQARMILAFTESGRSARLVSSFRAGQHLFGLTSKEKAFHRMALIWGVHPALTRSFASATDMYQAAAETLATVKWLKPTDLLVSLTGTFAVSGTSNTVRILTLSNLATAADTKAS
ncbi:MAG: pyruvate kinase [Planctomycetota bacterium]|nr:MAG: pyruvate kinase [Planctomycetota bacterium]